MITFTLIRYINGVAVETSFHNATDMARHWIHMYESAPDIAFYIDFDANEIAFFEEDLAVALLGAILEHKQ